MIDHIPLPSSFYARPVKVCLAGCGGSGSQVLSGLARLHTCLLAVGHPGLEVVAVDPDRVSQANVGRQLFAPADLGQFKTDVLINRLNLWYGVGWEARVERLTLETATATIRHCDLLIGCVDTVTARLEIGAAAERVNAALWLDLGNETTWGQVVLGHPVPDRPETPRLPTVLELFPHLTDSAGAEDDGPSCSLAESLTRQSAFINQMMATVALDALWRIFRSGRIDRFAWFVNLADGRMTSLAATAAVLGHYARRGQAA
ncbi:hypothetical protein CKO28_02580 [Rhodovibrio sodomensis]|uniref:THIF-type NAD/FAD binding fold domain-containing protein n=1 Tax=Rhodovibrio sodomensis TaxID=1088 RepID=A0ABS1D938_9PROT|nr:PRTRC system ThiF family protein [Rhodovibrio sodomensis]MBK1666928.1 hypothetical protein [Rhodovibrio sodomensis]